MKYLFRNLGFLVVAGLLFSCGGTETVNAPQTIVTPEAPALIPLPVKVEWKNGAYLVPQQNIICTSGETKKTSQWLEALLSKAGFQVAANSIGDCGNWQIVQDASLQNSLGEEGYKLEISDEGVNLKAASNAGLFYGIQTLRQMFPTKVETGNLEGQVVLRQGVIEDQPAYSWRGTMVDVARSFFDLDYLKRHVDRMALYKMNRLHLHLTDDQGWRIEIKSWPKLAEVGGKSSVRRGRSGYLTQEEYKELQDYALARNIIIIPSLFLLFGLFVPLQSHKA